MTPHLVRYIATADIVILVLCGAAMRASYAHTVPRILDVLALLYGVVLAAVGVGVMANSLSSQPLSPGVWVLVAPSTPIALVTLVLTFRSLRHR